MSGCGKVEKPSVDQLDQQTSTRILAPVACTRADHDLPNEREKIAAPGVTKS